VLHSRGTKLELKDAGTGEAAQPAVKVTDVGLEQQPANKTQHRITQVAMQGGHGTGGDTALESIAHYQVGAYPQFG